MAEKKGTKSTRKSTKAKEPGAATLLKKVAGVSDSTKVLSKEIKAMTKIFSENQKVLISMKNMIDTLSAALEQIQKQSRQLNIIEEDTQKLFTGLNQVRGQADLVSKINTQTARLQDQIHKISEEQKAGPDTKHIMQKVSDSFESIRNNSKMIMTISDRIDSVRDELKDVAERAKDSAVVPELAEIKKKIESISGKAEQIESLGGIINNLKLEFAAVMAKANAPGITDQLNELKRNIQSISSRTGNIGGDITTFKAEIESLAQKTEEKISGLSVLLNRSDQSASEFHKKTSQIIQEIQALKSASNRTSEYTSKDMMALLKLSEYQSNIRMLAETKYGTLQDLEKMATQTAEMVNLFDRLSIESGQKISLPSEVRKWSVSKILDCADRWEITFSDVMNILSNQLGKDFLKEALRVQQVRDIFGIRAVDEIRKEINIS
jgi:chromosome segregation ATPase